MIIERMTNRQQWHCFERKIAGYCFHSIGQHLPTTGIKVPVMNLAVLKVRASPIPPATPCVLSTEKFNFNPFRRGSLDR